MCPYHRENKLPLEIRFILSERTVGNSEAKKIRFRNLPQNYDFPEFEITDEMIYSSDMPCAVYSFSIDGKPFTVKMNIIQQALNSTNGIGHKFELFNKKDQIFQIYDDFGKVCADFDNSSYRIYGEENESLWVATAICSILRASCFGSQS